MTTTDTVRAEWIKLRSLRSNAWTIVAVVGLTVGLSALLAAVERTDASAAGQSDLVQNSLFGVALGQIAVAAFAVLAITAEHMTGTIRSTFTATPRRWTVLLSKTAVVAAVVFTAAALACVVSFLVAQPLLHGGGFVPPAYPTVSLTDGPVLRAVFGSALFLTAVAIIAVAVGAILRRTAGAITLMIGALLLPWVIGGYLSERTRELVRSVTPVAGVEIQSTVARHDDLPVGPWGGLAVTWAWAIGALLLALWLVERRDA